MQSNEILGVVDSVSTEKGLDKDVIFKAIEIAIASASQRHFHEDADLYVKIDRETGEYSTHRNWIVFDPDNEEFHHETHISKVAKTPRTPCKHLEALREDPKWVQTCRKT